MAVRVDGPAAIAAIALALALAGVGVGGTAVARAECAESSPSTGVVVRVCDEGGRRWIEARADLAAADVAVRVTRPGERGARVDAFAASVPGAVLAVQAGAFTFPSFDPAGLTVGEGEAWPGTHDDGRLGVLALDDRGAAILVPPEQVVPEESWMHAVVSGRAVLRAGTPAASCAGAGCDASPRTGIGLDEGERTLVIVVAAGHAADAAGVTEPELGAMLRDAGATDGIATGDGATSVLWSRADGPSIGSSDGASRPTAAFLALVDRATGVTARIRGVVQRAMAPEDVLPAASVRVETTDGRLVALGGTLTTGAYFEHTLPAREYVVRATLAGYRTGCKYCPTTAGGEVWCSVFLAEGDGAETCEPPPVGVTAGPWPVVDAGPELFDGGVRGDGGGRLGVDGGCSAGGAGRAGAGALAVLALAAIRRRAQQRYQALLLRGGRRAP
jgi:hypothetical protein